MAERPFRGRDRVPVRNVLLPGNTIISKWRLREHLPTKNVVAYTVRHYGLLVGIKKFTMPPEDKYFESEKAAYVMAVVTAALLVVTGLVKALATWCSRCPTAS